MIFLVEDNAPEDWQRGLDYDIRVAFADIPEFNNITLDVNPRSGPLNGLLSYSLSIPCHRPTSALINDMRAAWISEVAYKRSDPPAFDYSLELNQLTINASTKAPWGWTCYVTLSINLVR